MSPYVYEALDEALLKMNFQTPEQVVSYVLKQIPSFETITLEDQLWLLNQAKIQFQHNFSIRLFQEKEDHIANETKYFT